MRSWLHMLRFWSVRHVNVLISAQIQKRVTDSVWALHWFTISSCRFKAKLWESTVAAGRKLNAQLELCCPKLGWNFRSVYLITVTTFAVWELGNILGIVNRQDGFSCSSSEQDGNLSFYRHRSSGDSKHLKANAWSLQLWAAFRKTIWNILRGSSAKFLQSCVETERLSGDYDVEFVSGAQPDAPERSHFHYLSLLVILCKEYWPRQSETWKWIVINLFFHCVFS